MSIYSQPCLILPSSRFFLFLNLAFSTCSRVSLHFFHIFIQSDVNRTLIFDMSTVVQLSTVIRC